MTHLCLADPALVLGLRGDGRLELLGVFHDGVVVDILEVVDELLVDFRVEGATNFAGVVALIAPLGRLLLPSDVGLKIRAKLHLVNLQECLQPHKSEGPSKGIRKKRQISSYTVSKFVQKNLFSLNCKFPPLDGDATDQQNLCPIKPICHHILKLMMGCQSKLAMSGVLLY